VDETVTVENGPAQQSVSASHMPVTSPMNASEIDWGRTNQA